MNAEPEKLGRLVETAAEALRTLVSDPATSPSVRLRAVIMIFELASRASRDAARPVAKTGTGVRSKRRRLDASPVRIDEAARLLGIAAAWRLPPHGGRLN